MIRAKALGKHYHDISRSNGVWCRSTVLRILEDERYTGMYVAGKKSSAEIGTRKIIQMLSQSLHQAYEYFGCFRKKRF
ncbi:MAG: recombinase family protein [Ruminiclostridium sp.]